MTKNNIWDEFDNNFDTKALQKEIETAAENDSDYREVPEGKYEVAVEKIELVKSKTKGEPMVSIWFRVVGENDPYKGCMLFMNQVITQGFQIHIVNEFLRSMETNLDIQFYTYAQYGNLLMDVAEAVDGTLEFALDYSKNDKGYNVYKITEVFEA